MAQSIVTSTVANYSGGITIARLPAQSIVTSTASSLTPVGQQNELGFCGKLKEGCLPTLQCYQPEHSEALQIAPSFCMTRLPDSFYLDCVNAQVNLLRLMRRA